MGTLLRKSLLSIQGVLADVDGGCSANQVLLRAALARFLKELPARAASPWISRASAATCPPPICWPWPSTPRPPP